MSHAQVGPQSSAARRLTQISTTIQDACDAYAARLYFPVVCLVLLLMVGFTRWYGRKLAADWEQWVIADWLISYAPGFVRRGLSGEVLLAVSAWSGAPANMLVFDVIVGLCATFSVLFAALLASKRVTFWYFVLCLSPAFVLFTFYNEAAVGRKEWLVFVAFTAWALLHAWRRVAIGWCAVFAAIAFVLTLIHEMTFFFSPYFVLLAHLESMKTTHGSGDHTETPTPRDPDWRWSLMVPGASAVALIAIVLFSGSLNDPTLCDRLVGVGAPRAVCGGVFDYPDVPASAALGKAFDEASARTLAGVAAAAAIAIVPILIFLSANASRAGVLWRSGGLAIAAFMFSLPLFVLAVDWGRWIAIHTVLLTVTCSALLERKSACAPVAPLDRRATAAGVLGGTLVVASLFVWTPRYCCGTEMVTPWGPLTAISGMVEEIRANLAD